MVWPVSNAAGALINDGVGNLSYSTVSGTGSCTNQFPRTLNNNAAPTCASVAGTDFATQTANRVFAGPSSGSAAAPTFRAVAMADLPAAAQNAINAFVHANAGGI